MVWRLPSQHAIPAPRSIRGADGGWSKRMGDAAHADARRHREKGGPMALRLDWRDMMRDMNALSGL
jgi:hypothetical protein